MKLRFMKSRKLLAALVAVPALAVAVPLALPGTASAADANQCSNYPSTGGVSFWVCVQRVGANSVRTEIEPYKGTYVSGYLVLNHNQKQAWSGCTSPISAGDSCEHTYVGSGGTYQSVWHSKSSGTFTSPPITF
jgi:hypothetical protein